MNILVVLLKCLNLVITSAVNDKVSEEDWAKILTYMHLKGWLWVGFEKDELVMVVGGYRIKEFDEKTINVLPEKSEGTILYIPFMVSISEDRFYAREKLKKFLDLNKDITEVIFYNSDEKIPRRFKRIKTNEVTVQKEGEKVE